MLLVKFLLALFNMLPMDKFHEFRVRQERNAGRWKGGFTGLAVSNSHNYIRFIDGLISVAPEWHVHGPTALRAATFTVLGAVAGGVYGRARYTIQKWNSLTPDERQIQEMEQTMRQHEMTGEDGEQQLDEASPKEEEIQQPEDPAKE